MDLTRIYSSNISNTAYHSSLSPYRNRIIGGDFSTNPWQQGTSFTGLSGYNRVVDRFSAHSTNTDLTYDINRIEDAPTIAQAGMRTDHCYEYKVNTAGTLNSNTYSYFRQVFEGQFIRDMGFGISGTRYLTISFWIKSNLPKTYTIRLANVDNGANYASRTYLAEYTIDNADTWEYKTLTIPVCEDGYWERPTDYGLVMSWELSTGSDYLAAPNQWHTHPATITDVHIASENQEDGVAGSSFIETAGNYMRIALVQVEAGTQATPFEVLPPDIVLQRCQRYFFRIGSPDEGTSWAGNGQCDSSTSGAIYIQTPQTMRDTPTGSTNGSGFFRVRNANNSGIPSVTSASAQGYSPDSAYVSFTVSGGLSAGDATSMLLNTGGNNGYLDFSAEL